jgi:hypothetical protein
MNDIPSIGTFTAPSQNNSNYFLFFDEVGNILPLKKQYPDLPGTRVLLAFRGYPCSLNDIGGVASSFHWFSCGGDRSHPERSEGWNAEGEGMPPLLNQ